jgi:hypothetical protein
MAVYLLLLLLLLRPAAAAPLQKVKRDDNSILTCSIFLKLMSSEN